MKIIIHALGANMGGAIRHLSNFIPALIEDNNSNYYVLILRKDIDFGYKDEALQIVRVPKIIGSNFFLRTLFDAIYLPLYAIKVKADLVISLLNFGPVFCSKLHINFQRNALFFCTYYLDNINGLEKIFATLRSLFLFLIMKYANVIVTPSGSMAEIIKRKYPSLNTKHFITLYHGFKTQKIEAVDDYWAGILKEDKRVKILYPTHAASHKGFEILFEALSELKQSISDFVLFTTIDKSDWPEGFVKFQSRIKQLGINENIVFTGRIPQDQMSVFYKNCDIMVYPSLCESFGFSMVEAMGYGLPIVAADTAVNKEICKDAAVYYAAMDPNEAAAKILGILSESAREDLRNKAKERITSFDWSWERYTSEFLEIVSRYE